jgi:hypothetical protein
MDKSVSLALGTVLAISAMFSQVATAATPAASECSAKAVSKAGKPLAGAAKNAFMKKCEAEAVALQPHPAAPTRPSARPGSLWLAPPRPHS